MSIEEVDLADWESGDLKHLSVLVLGAAWCNVW